MTGSDSCTCILSLFPLVVGAVYHAASLSKLFKVKKFIVKEASTYPIQVRLLYNILQIGVSVFTGLLSASLCTLFTY